MTTKRTDSTGAKSKALIKTPNKPATPAAPATPATTSADEPLYTLEFLSNALPTPTSALLSALQSSHSEETCLTLGRSVASAKVLSDGARVVSAAYYHLQRSEPKVKSLLQEVGLTPMLLSAAVSHLSKLHTLLTHQERADFSSSATRQKIKHGLSQSRAQLLLMRDAAWSLAKFVARPDASLSAKVAAVATGTDTAAELSRQVNQLADVIELALLHKDDAVAALVAARGLTTAHVKRWRTEALAAEQNEQAQRAHSVSASVAQIELDRTDGLVILLLRELLRMLELAGKQDTSIRRIQLYTLSALLGRRPGRSAAQPLPDPAPALAQPHASPNAPPNAPVVAAPVSH